MAKPKPKRVNGNNNSNTKWHIACGNRTVLRCSFTPEYEVDKMHDYAIDNTTLVLSVLGECLSKDVVNKEGQVTLDLLHPLW